MTHNGITIRDMLEELLTYIEEDMATCSPDTCKGAYLNRLHNAVIREITENTE